MNVIRAWLTRHFSDPQVVALILILVAGLIAILVLGSVLAPVFAAVVLAYLLDKPVEYLVRLRLPRSLSAGMVSVALLVGAGWVLFALLPLLTQQAGQIVQQIPELAAKIQHWISTLPERYPTLITHGQIDAIINSTSFDAGPLRSEILSRSWVVGLGILYTGVYLILVPLMVFFILRDKQRVLRWFGSFVPANSALIRRVWLEVNVQLIYYIRGKAVEILIVWITAYLVFITLGLNYAMLLSWVVGFSVLIPYVGAFSMTLPVMVVAYAQWGMHAHTFYVLLAYIVLQMLDGNLLVPILFSEAVNLHPVAIIVSVLFFGGIWGFWGVFFAIPLATVVHAVIRAWPRQNAESSAADDT
ncbi:AI-2E family transporter [Salinisphaera sp. USBA-960]|uniref:AI-2E family transporter n=1 Tax=Salinisphaera orenii TaxID=856731 RepID=UPI000DBE0140|nr:AI-2E family transporter [Salifodinibacter halophilus]NNC26174.1 AI-2E family transporter [Salifodinibacter halophilus]